MAVYKNKSNNTWYVSVYFKNWKGESDRKVKRGFKTKREAQEWERTFLQQKTSDLDMTFSAFWELYQNDLREKIRENTWTTKVSVVEHKILPYFRDKKMSEIRPADILAWHNEMMSFRDEKGRAFSKTYLKTIHNQLSAIFNHAVRYYDLKSNPAAKVGNMGKEQPKEMKFWTKSEYLQFAEAMMDKPVSYYAFEMLYWCGLRLGEMKTPKSVRTVSMPDFLAEEMKEYINSLYGVEGDDRIFQITKSYMHHEMDRGCTQTGVKRIRIHDLRHSHVSLLIEMGFSVVAIANRVGHESIDITYRYAHMLPTAQSEMATKLDIERGSQNVS